MALSSEPRFYFSLRSPYSWLALHDLTTWYPDVAAAVEWRPFWEPDQASALALERRGGVFPYSAMSPAKHLYILQDVKRLAGERGLEPVWPIDRNPVWEVPHLAYLMAERSGLGREFVLAATEARWGHGKDICDPRVIAVVAAQLGLDPAAAAGAADDPGLRAEGVHRLMDVCADGVFGVPYFRQGRARYWGVDRLPAFAEHLRSKTDVAVASPVAGSIGDDAGHAGGCG